MIQNLYNAPGTGNFYPLFNLSTAKIERLCLVEWQNGQKYKALEVQYIDNTENGRGVLVILNSLDGKVNIYFEPSLTMDPAGYAIGSGLRHFQQTPFERAHFEIGPYGADVDVSFRDMDGDQVLIRIQEGGPKPPSSFSLLAPMGESIANPEWMPLFLLSQFGFVRRKNTEIEVRFGQEQVEVSRLPFPIGGERVYYARYCADPFIIFFNKQFDGPIEALQPGGPGNCVHAGVEYELVERKGHFEIAAAIVRNPRYAGRVSFDPPFPDAAAMAEGAAVHGKFTITGDPLHGRIDGVYSAERRSDQVYLRLHPSGGWTPAEQGFMLRLIFNLGKPFRNWPKSYEWNATLTLQKDGVYLKSGWRRL
jgi:hypothetical protein